MSENVIVPREPTEEMIEAGAVNLTRRSDSGKYESRGRAIEAWETMLAAAPTPERRSGQRRGSDNLKSTHLRRISYPLDRRTAAPNWVLHTPWEDARVQIVYNILCDGEPTHPHEHWEGRMARRIVDMLFCCTELCARLMNPPNYIQLGLLWHKHKTGNDANARMSQENFNAAVLDLFPETDEPDAHLREQIKAAKDRQARGEGIPGDADVAHQEPGGITCESSTITGTLRGGTITTRTIRGVTNVGNFDMENPALETAPPTPASTLPLSAETILACCRHSANAVWEAICDQALRAIELEPWKTAALRIGELLADTGPEAYYDFTVASWAAWCDNRIRGFRELERENAELKALALRVGQANVGEY